MLFASLNIRGQSRCRNGFWCSKTPKVSHAKLSLKFCICYSNQMRTIFTLMLCFFVACQGFAAHFTPAEPCPMMKNVSELFVENDEMAAPVADCCHDAKTIVMTGKLCKADTSCSTATACILFAPYDYPSTLKLPDSLSAKTNMTASRNPSSHWRPPSIQ